MPIPGRGGDPATLRLAAGRARASHLLPYLSTALFAVIPVRTDQLGTFAVDRRWRLYWDPAWCQTLTVDECAAVWVHEVGHLLRDHATRFDALLEPRDRQPVWNRAADAVINDDLRASGMVLPADEIRAYPEKIPGARRGMTAEQVYRLLASPAPPVPVSAPGGRSERSDPTPPENGAPGSGGSPTPSPPGDSGGGAETPSPAGDCGSGVGGPRRRWESAEDEFDTVDGSVDEGRGHLIRQQTARQIAEHAATRGTVPAGWRRWAETVLHPQVDWRAELNAVVRRTAASVAGLRDYTYTRPSRRAGSVPGVILPAVRHPRPPRVRVVIDTSGSMSGEMLAQCLAEIAAIVARASRRGGDPVEVIACDAAAADAQVARRISDLVLTGGGGTDMRVGMTAAARRRPKADLIVVLTDGETLWPDSPPPENPWARYVAVLVAGRPGRAVPTWMHTIVV